MAVCQILSVCLFVCLFLSFFGVFFHTNVLVSGPPKPKDLYNCNTIGALGSCTIPPQQISAFTTVLIDIKLGQGFYSQQSPPTHPLATFTQTRKNREIYIKSRAPKGYSQAVSSKGGWEAGVASYPKGVRRLLAVGRTPGCAWVHGDGESWLGVYDQQQQQQHGLKTDRYSN